MDFPPQRQEFGPLAVKVVPPGRFVKRAKGGPGGNCRQLRHNSGPATLEERAEGLY
jgi:hypothetical protein